MSMDGKADALIGNTIEGKYRIESKLGEGGMGTVYLSTRLMIGDTVAVKILHSTQVSDPQGIERFRREAQAAARLKHQNAVTIYDFGVSTEGLVYLVMELAEGQSLRDIIKQQGPVTPSAAAEIMSQVCAAVDAAHRQNIVHRDLKPDNIIVSVTNAGLRAKVLDFGIAKMRDLTASNLTQTGAVMGTPYYMSPEHCMGEELDHRSDIYSLGVVLFEMLAGVVPFNSPISTAVVVQHVNQAPPSLRALNASISPAVESVVMHALEKRRESRPQTAVQLAQELIASVQGKPLTPHSGSMPVSTFNSTPASTTPAATPVAGAELAPTIQMTLPPIISGARTAVPAKQRLPLMLGVVVVVMAVVIISLLIWASQSGRDANAPSLTAQWVQTNVPYGGIVNCFAVSGTNLFAGTDDGVFLSTNNGTSWTAVNSGLTYVQSLAISGTNVFAGTTGGLFLSTNNGTSWTAVNSGLTNAIYFRALAVSGTNVFAGTAYSGVFRSTDNGTSWTAVNSGLTTTQVSALAVSGTNLFAAFALTNGGRVYRSTNNGTSWAAVNSGLADTIVEAFAVSGTNVFAGTADGGVFRSTNNGTSWTAVNSGLTNTTYIGALAVSGTNLFAGTEGGGVFRSTDNGTSWTAVNSGLTSNEVSALAVSGTNLFAGTKGGGVWKRPLSEMITSVH